MLNQNNALQTALNTAFENVSDYKIIICGKNGHPEIIFYDEFGNAITLGFGIGKVWAKVMECDS